MPFPKLSEASFSKGGAELRLPIYLETKLQHQLERLSRKTGKDVGDMVNELVKKEVELIQRFL
jgi:hypothetical protein